MQRHEALQVDVALQNVEQVADLEVVDGNLEVADAARRQQPIRVDAARGAAAQLEALHRDSLRSRLDGGWMRRLPDGRIESELHVRDAQLTIVGTQDVVALETVVPLIALAPADLDAPAPVRAAIGEIRLQTVEGKARRIHRVAHQSDRHDRYR